MLPILGNLRSTGYTCQRRFTKMSCLSQITLDWHHFAQVGKASQIECSKLFFNCTVYNHASFSKRARFCPQFTRMLCQPHNKPWSYTNTSAAVIVCTSGVSRIFQWGGSKVTSTICSQFILWQISNLVQCHEMEPKSHIAKSK